MFGELINKELTNISKRGYILFEIEPGDACCRLSINNLISGNLIYELKNQQLDLRGGAIVGLSQGIPVDFKNLVNYGNYLKISPDEVVRVFTQIAYISEIIQLLFLNVPGLLELTYKIYINRTKSGDYIISFYQNHSFRHLWRICMKTSTEGYIQGTKGIFLLPKKLDEFDQFKDLARVLPYQQWWIGELLTEL